MWILLLESTMVGIITLIIGTIIFDLSINKLNKDMKKPYGMKFAFFITGVILHMLLEVAGFNTWYCDRDTCSKYKFVCKLAN